MGNQIIKQPNGKFCVYSSIIDDFTIVNAEPADIVNVWASQEREKLTQKVTEIVEKLDSGESPYHQFTMSFEEAVSLAREVHGDSWQPPLELSLLGIRKAK